VVTVWMQLPHYHWHW